MPAINELMRFAYSKPGGKWILSKAIGRTAPYSGTIGAEIQELRAGYARLRMPDRRKVRNHLDSIHACALSTLTETTVGISVLYTLPAGARGIATSLHVDYLAKARGPITAECEWDMPDISSPCEQDLAVSMKNESGETVAQGKVRFRFQGPKSA